MGLKPKNANNQIFQARMMPAAKTAADDALKKFGELVDRHFDNNNWKPLSPYTIKIRKQQGFPAGPPLVRSGVLRKNIAKRITPAVINGLAVAGRVEPDNSAKTGYTPGETIGDYAADLDKDRPFWDLSQQDMDELKNAFIQAFLAAMK